MSQSQFDAEFAEGAAKIFKEYLDDQIKGEAVVDAAVLAEAKELGVLPMAVSHIEDLTCEDPADQSVPQIEQSALRKIHVAVRLLSEVLQPQVFKSDWRVKFEKKVASKTKHNAKMPYAAGQSVKSSAHYHKGASIVKRESEGQDKARKDWKVGGFVKRQKNAAMSDFAM